MRSSLFTKLSALALAALMLLPLASCATTTDGNGTDTSGNQAQTQGKDPAQDQNQVPSQTTPQSDTPADTAAGDTTPAQTDAETLPGADDDEPETDDSDYVCDLPDDLNYGGTEVNIMYVKVAAREDELVSEQLGSGSIADSVFERNLKVESQLGVKLAYTSFVTDTDAQSRIRTLVKAGDDTMHIFTLGTYCAVDPAIEGNYLNLNNVEYINLDKHYWSQDYNEVFTFTNDQKRFIATSPAALSLFRLTYLTIFNRDLFADHNLPDLYSVVENGEWTLDYQFSLISDMWRDSDGDGVASEGDFFGLITGNCISVDAYCVASDIHMVVLDESGYLSFNKEDCERIIDMSEKVSKIYNTTDTYFFKDQTYDDIGKHYINEKFTDEGGLMATTQFWGIEHNIEALNQFSYGIVPMPKLNVQQEKYMTYVQDQVTAFGISAAVGNAEQQSKLGAVMEALAYYSNTIVRPTYYDSALSLRFMQDPNSRAILDTMFETISFDYCYATGFGDLRGELRTRLSSKTPAVASRVTVWERSFDRQITRKNEALDKLP